MEDTTERAVSLDRTTSFALIIIAEVQALLLYIAHEANGNAVALFTDRTFLTVWYTLIVLPPLTISLQLRSVRDRFVWSSGLAFGVVVGLLAWHTGAACGTDEAIECGPVVGPYGFSLSIGTFILLPFIQGFREHGWRIPYASLFHDSWDNALALAATGFFIGAAWLILILWAALFSLVGIEFFKELFAFPGFIYPVTGLLAGFGVVLARHQAGALQAVLRVCLALGRALLPLICILALAFLGTLLFTGIQPLWDTKKATLLLLLLIFGTVALVNSVLHDGTGVESYRPALRRLLGAALLTLPVYAVIAAISLKLRIDQYGWTVDRLWAALLIFIAGAYALAYASSVVVKVRGRWLGLLPTANVVVALTMVASLFTIQSPFMDFRSITVGSQLARLGSGTDLEGFDFEYFRWELGRPGYEALLAMKTDPRITAVPAIAKQVESLIEARQRWGLRRARVELAATDLRVIPKGQEVPAGLLDFINGLERSDNPGDCYKGGCVLVGVDLGGDAGPEWMLFDTKAKGWVHAPVYAKTARGWEVAGFIQGSRIMDPATQAALEKGAVSARTPEWRDLVIGDKQLRMRDKAPWD